MGSGKLGLEVIVFNHTLTIDRNNLPYLLQR